MQDKENVYEVPQTEQGWKMDGAHGASVEKKGSADLGKFKDVNALMQAYQSLQAEFTRRSQRLKKCEEELDKRNRALLETDGSDDVAKRGVAKSDAMECGAAGGSAAVAGGDGEGQFLTADAPEKTCERPNSAMEERVDDEGAGKEDAIPVCADGQNITAAVTDTGNDEGVCAEKRDLPSLYEQVLADEKLRLKIVGDYLSSIGKSGAPLVKGGVGVLATPPKKANSISDAGKMSLAYLCAQKGQA